MLGAIAATTTSAARESAVWAARLVLYGCGSGSSPGVLRLDSGGEGENPDHNLDIKYLENEI
jgi:hypothetical protein